MLCYELKKQIPLTGILFGEHFNKNPIMFLVLISNKVVSNVNTRLLCLSYPPIAVLVLVKVNRSPDCPNEIPYYPPVEYSRPKRVRLQF